MFRLIRWGIRGVVLLVLFGLGMVVGAPFVFSAAGRYLITDQPLTRADLIFPLAQDVLLTVPEAARLYHEGLAPRILLIAGPGRPGKIDLLRRGIRVPDTLDTSLTILEGLKVPREAIQTDDVQADDLVAEAEAVARFLNDHPARAVIVVTPKSRSTRALKVFGAVLGRGIRLIVHPAPRDPFDPAGWWRDRKDRREVVSEFQSLADFWLAEAWHKVARKGREMIRFPRL
jgi:uncharacterized SAM-binding protein YcdF (DUF218 family)